MLLRVQMSNLAKNGNLGSQSESGPSGGEIPDRVRKPTTVRRSRKSIKIHTRFNMMMDHGMIIFV